MYYEKIKKILDEIDLTVISTIDIDNTSEFDMIVQGVFCKCLQISKLVHEEIFNKNSFLFLPQLRGVCEEIIVLKFINELFESEEKNELIKAIIKSTLKADLKQQVKFLQKYRPAQPILDETLAEHFPGLTVHEILNRNKIKGYKIPPTVQMAEKVGLSELYNFVYRASCSFVHFNPRIIQRTIWQDEKSENYRISITNFHKYYFAFSSFYLTYLLGLMQENFSEILNIEKDTFDKLNSLKEETRRKVHYPDLVTFEEVNIKRPKTELTIINDFLENQLFKGRDYR